MKGSDALYVISVAARLVDLHPTTLRKYERAGFLAPSRTAGRTRLYSGADIQRLHQIKRLMDEREVNLAGVDLALEVAERLHELERAIATASDLESLRHSARRPLRQALAAVGAGE